jgi:Fe-coproporphyrin III synthase
VWLLRAFAQRHPDRAAALRERLVTWGGNQAGVRLLNIDPRGELKPDPFFEASFGNVLEHDPRELLAAPGPLAGGLCQSPRTLQGRCGTCAHLDICNGSSRARAFAATGNYFAEDPSCFV